MKHVWAVVTFVFVAASCGGCWPIRVDPQTEAVCPTRPNCGQCASDELCAWLATEVDAERRCYPRSEVGDRPRQVRVLELCPEGPLGWLPEERTSGSP